MYFKKRNKKGALELSMNTIVIIVIGVTLLILGLAFVRGMFSKITELSEGAFEKAEGQIGDVSNIKQPLTAIPEAISLQKGKGKLTTLVVANFKEKEATALTVTATPVGEKSKDITCTFEESGGSTVAITKLPSGEFKTLKVLVVSDDRTALGYKTCKFATKLFGEDQIATVSINVGAK